MDMDDSLINDRAYAVNKSRSLCSLQRITIVAVIGLIAWLSVVTAYLVHDSVTKVEPGTATTAVMSTTVSLPLSSLACAGNAEIQAGTPVSFDPADGSIVTGAGTTVYVGAQHHDYGTYTPNHLNVVPLESNTVLFGLGLYVIVGDGGSDWVTGGSFPFNVSADAPVPAGWGQFYEFPSFVDEIVLLSINNNVALLIAVGGGGVMGLQVDVILKTVAIGNHTAFVTGPSVDTDTAAIGPSNFAISYFYDAPDNSIQLMTIAGSVSSTLNVTFGEPVNYSPNHMFHQILALSSGVYALGFPHDDMAHTSSASPMGILIASVDSNNKITIWSADGKGAPWLQSYVLGYYFFDMILVNHVLEVDGLTAVGSMAVVDRSAADAISIVTFRVTASGSSASGWSEISCVFGSQITVTQPGATINYNYFAMQPLFSLVLSSTSTPHQRSLKGSASFTPASVKNDFVVAWQDTSKYGAVDAVIVSYSPESGSLGLVMESTEISPSVASGKGSHWWIAGGALPGGRMMILTTLGSVGNITLVEHRGEVVGVVASSISCDGAPSTSLNVSVNGHIKVDAAMMYQGAVSGPTVWATARGWLISGTMAIVSTSEGQYDVIVGEDGCVGLVDAVDGGVWIWPDIC